MSEQTETPVTLAALPKVGETLATGTFAGIITQQDGTHVAVILLPNQAEDLTWQAAMDWAAEQGGQLPTRPIAAMLLANVNAKLQSADWHWTNETQFNSASYAWYCTFYDGYQITIHKSYQGCAVAVRLIPLTA